MNWARYIDFEDLLEGDAQWIYEECGEEVLLPLLGAFAGKKVSLKSGTAEALKRRYIREQGDLTTRELARRLDVSESLIRDVRGDSISSDRDSSWTRPDPT